MFPNLFRTFRVALDPRKLLLAAAGILVMSGGWWLLSWAAYGGYSQPKRTEYTARPIAELERKEPGKPKEDYDRKQAAEQAELNHTFNEDSDFWLQFHRLAGSSYATVEYAPESGTQRPPRTVWGGMLRTAPWFEDRGPNPFLLITGKTGRPWDRGQFADWFITREVPVLLEPLVKFLTPIVELLNPNTGSYTRAYLLLIVLWTLATWAFFGGAITRMAAVELAGKDSVTVKESMQFVTRRYVSYLLGPLVPLILVFVLVIVSAIFGLLHMIPFVGDIFVSGLFWPVMILIGLGMALLLVGLVGYPLMYPTISTEGSDTLDALTRSYNYVFTSPWNYIGYSLLAILYGAVVVFFVGFVGSLTVYLGKWGMSYTPGIKYAGRSPEYLFIYTPTSFGWREVLLEGSPGGDLARMNSELSMQQHRGDLVGPGPQTIPENRVEALRLAEEESQNWHAGMWWYQKVGAAMVSFWITLLFLMVLGFGYSFFWTASSMIYLLMRKRVDEMDLDEVYLEESDEEDIFGGPPTMPVQKPEIAPVGTSQLQESISVRQDRSMTQTEPSAQTGITATTPEPPPPEPPPPESSTSPDGPTS